MALILAIDTSTKVCSIALHRDAQILGAQTYHLQKSHSSLLPAIIDQLVENCELKMSDIEAVAVSAGPGSYTGLRIGTSTAKGLCFGLDVPLVSISSLDAMFEKTKSFFPSDALICPMIDARRMEVFCCLKRADGHVVWDAQPKILDEQTFKEFSEKEVFLVGDGASKCKELYHSFSHIQMIEGVYPDAAAVGLLAQARFNQNHFEDVAYFEPDYLKEYRTIPPKQQLKA